MSTQKLRVRFLNDGACTDRIEWGETPKKAAKNITGYGKLFPLKNASEWSETLRKKLMDNGFAAVYYAI